MALFMMVEDYANLVSKKHVMNARQLTWRQQTPAGNVHIYLLPERISKKKPLSSSLVGKRERNGDDDDKRKLVLGAAPGLMNT